MVILKRYPKGHFLGIGIAIGLPVGLVIGFALDMFAIGPALGAALGLGIGAAMEAKYNPNPREFTIEEQKQQKIAMWAAIVLLALGLITLAVFYLVA
ncbi:hypothetical protein K9M79_04115 [Candidatus Woesearchaeota archaeon]|nr:hypothetical protein [Candidatus Woesearchaeota archaeon]